MCIHLHSKADLAPFSLMDHDVLLRLVAIRVPLNAAAPQVCATYKGCFVAHSPPHATRELRTELLQILPEFRIFEIPSNVGVQGFLLRFLLLLRFFLLLLLLRFLLLLLV